MSSTTTHAKNIFETVINKIIYDQCTRLVLLQLQMTDSMDNLEELLRLSGGDGQIFTVEGPLCMKSVQAMFGYDSYWQTI